MRSPISPTLEDLHTFKLFMMLAQAAVLVLLRTLPLTPEGLDLSTTILIAVIVENILRREMTFLAGNVTATTTLVEILYISSVLVVRFCCL